MSFVVEFVADEQGELLAGGAADFHDQRALKFWNIAFKGLTQAAVQFRIAGLPELVALMHTREVNTRTETEPGVLPMLFDTIDATAFFGRFRVAGVKYHTIAGFQRALQPEADSAAFDASDFAEVHAAFLAEAGMDELLVVDAAEPARVKPARKGHLHFV